MKAQLFDKDGKCVEWREVGEPPPDYVRKIVMPPPEPLDHIPSKETITFSQWDFCFKGVAHLPSDGGPVAIYEEV